MKTVPLLCRLVVVVCVLFGGGVFTFAAMVWSFGCSANQYCKSALLTDHLYPMMKHLYPGWLRPHPQSTRAHWIIKNRWGHSAPTSSEHQLKEYHLQEPYSTHQSSSTDYSTRRQGELKLLSTFLRHLVMLFCFILSYIIIEYYILTIWDHYLSQIILQSV